MDSDSFLYISSANDLDWQDDALCKGSSVLLPEEVERLEAEVYGRTMTEEELSLEQIRKLHNIFFPARGESATTAKAFCARCPSQMACLEYSLVNGVKFGVWGGAPYRTRRRVRSMRKKVRLQRLAGDEPKI